MSGHIVLTAGTVFALYLLASATVHRIAEHRARRHDPYAEPLGDLPFIPSAGVARPDAGGRVLSPQPARPPAAFSAWGSR